MAVDNGVCVIWEWKIRCLLKLLYKQMLIREHKTENRKETGVLF